MIRPEAHQNYQYTSAIAFKLLLFSQSHVNVFIDASTRRTYFRAITSNSFTPTSAGSFNFVENLS
ncbi:hypothetical protein CPB86DRAFT_791523 [Serendipita vermifera]|nr:hypothetical protein CPB86DRAFT_791523 [Serendipita vermifera]